MNKMNRKFEKYNIIDDNKLVKLYYYMIIEFIYNKKYITFYSFALNKTNEII